MSEKSKKIYTPLFTYNTATLKSHNHCAACDDNE